MYIHVSCDKMCLHVDMHKFKIYVGIILSAVCSAPLMLELNNLYASPC